MNKSSPAPQSPWTIVIIGLVALAIAMGIGRFAFTPLMPLMVRDGTLEPVIGAEWAAANYVGYLLGAFTAPRLGRDPRLGLRIGLLGVVLTTLGIAWGNASFPLIGAVLRGSAGIFSAWVLVCASSWCLSELAGRNSTSRGGWIYIGVGVGIAITGVMAWLGGNQSAVRLWIELAILAAVGTAYVLRGLPVQSATSTTQSSNTTANQITMPHSGNGNIGIVLCYSVSGFGYIVPATFLPSMARQLVTDPLVFGLTWPIFGTAAALSIAIVSRWLSAWPRRKIWAVAQVVMAAGTLLPLLQQTIWILAASAALVGGTFMVTTMAGLQLARERMPSNSTPLLARMTAGFAGGQIAGPILVRLVGSAHIAGWDALSWANAVATILLTVTSIWLWRGCSPLPERSTQTL